MVQKFDFAFEEEKSRNLSTFHFLNIFLGDFYSFLSVLCYCSYLYYRLVFILKLSISKFIYCMNKIEITFNIFEHCVILFDILLLP